MSDAVAFGGAFALVWAGLGLYLVRLHRLAERLSEEVARIEAKERPADAGDGDG